MQTRIDEILRDLPTQEEKELELTGPKQVEHVDPRDTENISLNAKERQFFYPRYQKLVDKYQKDVDAKGGVEGTIKIIDDRLVNTILELEDKINVLVDDVKSGKVKIDGSTKKADIKDEKDLKKPALTDTEKHERVKQIVRKVRKDFIGPNHYKKISLSEPEKRVAQQIESKMSALQGEKTRLKKQLNALKPDDETNKAKLTKQIDELSEKILNLPTGPFSLRADQFEAIVAWCALNDIDDEYLRTRRDGDRYIYPNVYHKGALDGMHPILFSDSVTPEISAARKTIPPRTMLAFVIAAGLDPKMEVHMTRKELKEFGDDAAGMEKFIAKKYGSRELLNEECITDVISALTNMRRSHNVDMDWMKYAVSKDAHACSGGAEGCILKYGNKHNKLIAKPALTTQYHCIPMAIEDYILDQIKHADDETRKAFYNYAFNKYTMFEPVPAEDEARCQKFLDAILSKKDDVLKYIYANVPGLPMDVEMKDHRDRRFGGFVHRVQVDKIPDRVKKASNDLLEIYIHGFKDDPGFSIRQETQASMLRVTHEVLCKDLKEKLIRDRIVDYKSKLDKIIEEFKQFKRVIEADKVRGLLAPEYLKNTFTDEDILVTRDQFNDLCAKSFNLELEKLAGQIADEFKKGLLDIQTGSKIPTTVEINEFIAPVKKACEKLLKNIERDISDTAQSLFELEKLYQIAQTPTGSVKEDKDQKKAAPYATDITLNEIQASIPTLPGMRPVQLDSSPESWALRFIYLAFEKDPVKKQFVRDAREISRLIELMQEHFDEKDVGKIDSVMRHINIYLKEYELPRAPGQEILPEGVEEPERFGARALLQKMFLLKGLDLKNPDVQPPSLKMKSLLIRTKFSGDDKLVAMAQKSPINSEWQRAALGILGSGDVKLHFEKFANFMLLTLFSNLGIPDVAASNAKSLRRLCAQYLGIEPLARDRTGQPEQLAFFKEGSSESLTTRLEHLGQHVNAIIRSLKPVAGLFRAGSVSLMNPEESKQSLIALQERGVTGPCCIRVSLRKPEASFSLAWLERNADDKSYGMESEPIETDLEDEDCCFERADEAHGGGIQLKNDFYLGVKKLRQEDNPDDPEPNIANFISIGHTLTASAPDLKGLGQAFDQQRQAAYVKECQAQSDAIDLAASKMQQQTALGAELRNARPRYRFAKGQEAEKAPTQKELTAMAASSEAVRQLRLVLRTPSPQPEAPEDAQKQKTKPDSSPRSPV